MVLSDLGWKSGKEPIVEKDFERFPMTAVSDFLRHAKPEMLNDSVDLVPTVNEWMLFDAINSFERLFNGKQHTCGRSPPTMRCTPRALALSFENARQHSF